MEREVEHRAGGAGGVGEAGGVSVAGANGGAGSIDGAVLLSPSTSGIRFGDLDHESRPFTAIVDEAGRFSFVSPLAAAVFGVAPADAVGRSMFQYVHAADVERALLRHATVLRHPETVVVATIALVGPAHRVRMFELEATNGLHRAEYAGIVLSGSEVAVPDDTQPQDRAREPLGGTGPKADSNAGPNADPDACPSPGPAAPCAHLVDPLAADHHQQVSGFAGTMARALDLPAGMVADIEVAASLHDLGLLGTRSGMPTPIDAMSPPNTRSYRLHPRVGAMTLADLGFPWPVVEIVLQHHEHLDGSGFPEGLRGRAIGTGARVIAAADVVSTISPRRAPRPPSGSDAAMERLEEGRGRCYDPDVVDICLGLFRDDRFTLAPEGCAS